jgi:DNA polymerase-3 subunit alpha
MSRQHFVHLRLHSEFSIVDGIVRIDDAVAAAAADGMGALALTDLGNMFGMVKFYQAARKKGVKPVLGCDVWITNEAERDKPFRLLLLARSRAGYLRLADLLSRAYVTNQHRGRAEIRKAWLAECGGEGLAALSGAMAGDVGTALLADHGAAAEKAASEWASIFRGAYYIELQRAGQPHTEAYIEAALWLAGHLGLPVVATHPVQFAKRDDSKAHDARVCIAEGYVLGDRRRPRAFTSECYFKTQAEMAALFADLPEALENSVALAQRCNLAFELGKSRLPAFPTAPGVTLEDELTRASEAGFAKRMTELYPDPLERERQTPRYRERLAFEIKTIIQMGFAGYFLIVADFINWARTNGIPVGPGRGSGAGSLVAYALRITDLDPLKYDLLFERFLNPERVSMPDFDIDFCQDGRDRVIDYVRRKYGADAVAQIATFGTMAAKAVVRDVGRVLEWTYTRADELAKLIPFQPGKLVTLDMARSMEPRLREREEAEEDVRELLALAQQLEGLTRNVGMHAGGVLIAPGKLTDFCPLYAASGADSVMSQLDKDDVEAMGLVKFDLLGLTTLTILDWTLRYVKRLDPESRPALERLPLDDPQTYRIFSAGNTTAVFQFESRGMRDLVKRARPDRFEDLIALVALFRPGPMDLIPEFIERKQGRSRVDYPDPRVEPILAPTYGIMVYQEQVMQIAQVIGGYSLGAADLLRRAMGKKLPEEMAKQRDAFIGGAARNGVEPRKANELFDLMAKFAGYGFNKSHAAAYALIAFQTAYMKAHHPASFMAANLSAVMDDTDKVQHFYLDAVANGLKVLPPDINASDYRFVPVDERTIRYGLGAVKGTGEAAIGAIVQARAVGGPFSSLMDFCERIDKRIVNRRAIEALVRAGAFDAIDDHRARLAASLGVALEAAEQASRDARQVSLFGAAEHASRARPVHVEAPRWDERRRLAEEKTALGFYLSGHPFGEYRRELGRFVRGTLADLQPRNEPVIIAGSVAAARTAMTRRGKMAVVMLDDGTAQAEVAVYNELWDARRDAIQQDRPLIVQGKVVKDEFTGGLRVVADKLWDLAGARTQFARGLRLALNGDARGNGAAVIGRLRELLTPYRNGTCPVKVCYASGSAIAELKLGEAWRVTPADALIDGLSAWLKPENVEVVYSG